MSVRLNENKEIVAKIREGLKRKGGHCPCKLEVSPATKMYLSGVPGSDCRSQLRGVLPLPALLQIQGLSYLA